MDATTSRLEALERQVERVQGRRDYLLALRNRNVRWQLSIFVVGFFVVATTLAASRLLGVLFLLAGIIAIVVVGIYERKLTKRLPLYNARLQLLEIQVARARLDWDLLPEVPLTDREEGADHPFDVDLDITGARSLHRLINTAVSVGGIERLRQWLLARSPNLQTIRQRQLLVRELLATPRFRNRFLSQSYAATRLNSSAMEAELLSDWLETQNASGTHQRLSTLIIACIFSASIYASVLLFAYAAFSPLFFVAALVLSLGWFLLTSKEQGNLAEDTFYLRRTLGQLKEIFAFLENYRYPQYGQLRTLCEPFYGHGDRNPSPLFKKLKRIASRAELARQPGTWTGLNVLFPIGALTAYQLDRCKEQVLHYLPEWLDAWYELECLCSLANFAYLNPEYAMPELVDHRSNKASKRETPAVFEARGLSHPLLNKEKKVANDCRIERLSTIMMITGSNMAGKSTFLRTIGINLCLAYAGGVVNASSLRTSLFEIYACIRVTDSLADGYSYFYAEVRRLKGLLEAVKRRGEFPVFFLIDEIFRGTNNYERLIGSESYIHALAGERCVGAISTHDLELVKLADVLPGIVNMHFREDVIAGKMVFDYVLRSGPCPTRNALKIMEMEGLPIRRDTQAEVKK